MKKIFLSAIILSSLLCPKVFANEITEDYIDMATSYTTEGNYAEAIRYINKALAIAPNDNELLELKDTLYGFTDPNFQSVITKQNHFFANTRNAKKQGDKNQEISILKQYSNNGNFWATYILAGIYNDTNDYPNALVYYQKAFTLRPQAYETYISIGKTQYKCKQYNLAIRNFETYLKRYPKSDIALALKAECLFQANKLDDAMNSIDSALMLSNNPEYKLIKGKILYNKGFYLESKNIFTELIENFATAETYGYLGLCQYKLRNYADSMLNLNKAILLSDDEKNLQAKYNEVKSLLEATQQ